MSEKYDVVVIGSGPGGYATSIRSSQLGMKTACIDKRKKLGGTCLNEGCVSSKALIYASLLYEKIKKESQEWGIETKDVNINFKKTLEKKNKIVEDFAKGIHNLFEKNKIKEIHGTAKLISPHSISITDEKGGQQEIQAGSIVLATGADPISLPCLDFKKEKVISPGEALNLKYIPNKMIIVGAGIIGLEIGSIYSKLGSEIVFIERLESFCPFLDKTISKIFYDSLLKEGFAFHLGSLVARGKINEERISLIIAEEKHKQSTLITGDIVLASIGRKPSTNNLGIEDIGVQRDKEGRILVDENFRSTISNIYAIGDIIEGPMLAHRASEEGIAVAESIAGNQASVNYMAIPSVIYTYPEVASVGMTEEEAKKFGLCIQTGTFPYKDNSKAKCIGREEGLVKIIAEKNTGVLIGMHIIGENASELICVGSHSIEKKSTILEMTNYIYPYPSLSEVIKKACLDLCKKNLSI